MAIWIIAAGQFGILCVHAMGNGVGDSKGLQSQPPLNAEKILLLPAAISSVSSVQPAVQASPVCMEWGDFSGNYFSRATAALSALKLGNNLTQKQAEHISGGMYTQ